MLKLVEYIIIENTSIKELYCGHHKSISPIQTKDEF